MSASRAKSGDIDYCAEVACIPGGTLSVSHRFARPDVRDRLLVLHAMLETLVSIPFQASDPVVASAKVAWWRRELSEGFIGESAHPLVHAMRLHGVVERLDASWIDSYFDALVKLAIGGPIADWDSLEELARGIGGNGASMEAALVGSDADTELLVPVGAAMFLARLILEPRTMLCSQSWWLPMDLQARHGITLGMVEAGEAARELENVLVELGHPVRVRLKEFVSGNPENPKSVLEGAGVHHLKITAALLGKRLGKMNGDGRLTLRRPGLSVGELFTAWRVATGGSGFTARKQGRGQ